MSRIILNKANVCADKNHIYCERTIHLFAGVILLQITALDVFHDRAAYQIIGDLKKKNKNYLKHKLYIHIHIY